MTFAMDFALDDRQIDALRSAVVAFCTHADILAARERYPGERPQGDFAQPDRPVSYLIDEDRKVIELENAYFSHSFLLRVLEQKWIEAEGARGAELRRDVLLGAPALIRPSLDVPGRVRTIAAALDAMLGRVAERPRRGRVGDMVVFDRLCRARGAIQALATVLAGFSALKTLQDNLVMLRVQGAPWLAAPGIVAPGIVAPGLAEPPSPEPLAVLADLAAAAATTALPDLPAEARPLAEQCAATCKAAATQLRRAAAAQMPAIIDLLNHLVARVPRQIQNVMFTISRDLPLRDFRGLFAGQDEVICAVIDLCDTLRRRLMQYWLFEQVDMHILRMREIIADPTPDALAELDRHYWIVDTSLRGLIGDRPGSVPLFSAFADVLTDWDLRPGPPQSEADIAAHGKSLAALDALRDGARAAGLKLDQQLRTEIGHLASLRPQLEAILARIPLLCMTMVGR